MITLLDGGMGYELKARGVKVPDYTKPIWSALALLEDPEGVVDVHAAYLEAGADVLTINNYSVTPPSSAAAVEPVRNTSNGCGRCSDKLMERVHR